MVRILGSPGRGRRLRSLFGLIGTVALIAAFVAPGAQAIHLLPDTSFELDKDALDNGPVADALDDWENVFNNTDSATNDTGIVPDPFGTTIYTTGGSKDDLDVTRWRHKSGSVPPKDEISDAYAALYDVSGESRLYFGADRFANNGSAQIGFWFFQNEVTLITSGPDAGKFDGVHVAADPGPDGLPRTSDDLNLAPGDILILSDFTQGGAISTIRAFEWVGTGGSATSNGTLELVDAGVDCSGAGSHDPPSNAPEFCGEVNGPAGAPTDGTDAPWDYTPKFGDDGFFPFGSFYEGGIDLTAFGFGGVCFSSFLAETRSSPSVDATLKDFVLGAFAPCSANIVTEASSSEIFVGDPIHDEATILAVGTGAPAPKGQVEFFVCGPDAGLCVTGGTSLGTVDLSANTLNPVTVPSADFEPTLPGDYCFRADWTLDPFYDDDSDDGNNPDECFTVVQITPTISTTQTFTVKDSATIEATGGGNLTGSVRFRLYPNADCSGTTTLVDQSIAVSGASPQTKETTPVTILDPGQPVLSWLVEYTSTNPAQTGVTSTCATENASLDIDDGP